MFFKPLKGNQSYGTFVYRAECLKCLPSSSTYTVPPVWQGPGQSSSPPGKPFHASALRECHFLLSPRTPGICFLSLRTTTQCLCPFSKEVEPSMRAEAECILFPTRAQSHFCPFTNPFIITRSSVLVIQLSVASFFVALS